tara:strand:- start:128 stop:475 length:348 start_codon:yes stop_codon:yes gene_type:complete
MNVNPLDCILEIYNNKDKVFQEYLDKTDINKIKGYLYFDETIRDLYLNDNISLIQKNTGKYFKKGKIISIDENMITIKLSNHYITVNKNNYYIFIKDKKNKLNNREFYKALLNQL